MVEFMYAKIRPRRGTVTEWQTFNPILLEGEFAIEYPDNGVGTGLCRFKIGDGQKPWNDIPYAFDAGSASEIQGGGVDIYHTIALRSATTLEWETADPVLELNEIIFDTTKQAFKVGDGQHSFNELKYIGYDADEDKDYDFGDLDEIDD